NLDQNSFLSSLSSLAAAPSLSFSLIFIFLSSFLLHLLLPFTSPLNLHTPNKKTQNSLLTLPPPRHLVRRWSLSLFVLKPPPFVVWSRERRRRFRLFLGERRGRPERSRRRLERSRRRPEPRASPTAAEPPPS
ncbi:hypothetical protein LINPERHAP2_LOCUS12064, partial [Linum perenne]